MTESVKIFIKKFDAEISLEESLIVREDKKFFLIPPNLKNLLTINGERCCYAGILLGEFKNGRFLPSFPLLFMISEKAKNKIFVNDKAAWLFICGRDIFKEGIIRAEGSTKRGNYTLIFNTYGECLGFGLIRQELYEAKKGVVVENVLDLGDFLRRERNRRGGKAK